MKVIIAEDEAVSRTILRRTVERLGHECLVARDGQEAWELFERTPDVEVIVSDWAMPNVDGLELCRRVRAAERPGYVFFIFLTALEGEEHLLEGMKAGADEYLTKPLDVQQLKVRLISASRATSARRHLDSGEQEEAVTGNGSPETAVREQGGGRYSVAGRRAGIKSGKVWDILISQGKITEDQLQHALMVQKDDPRELGQILVSLGHIAKADLARAQAERLRLEYVELTDQDVDRGVALMVDQKVLRRHAALPLRLENGRLVVAMSDPTNIYALEDLTMISGYPVTPAVAVEEDIQRVHNKIFAMGEGVTEILEEAAGESFVEDIGDIQLGDDGDEAPIIRLVGSILQQAMAEGASDIHIEPRPRELAVRFRVDGVLKEVMSIPPKLQGGVIARLKVVANLNIAERRVPQDGRFSVKLGGQKLDLRVASLPTVHGEKVVLRLLDTSFATVNLTRLGFPPGMYGRYEEIFRRPYGAVLVTGPTGSGKSTTLYATLNELNTPEKNIITVEDPVEYRMVGINQVQTNPRAGLTFASALRSILRSDPDVVMIGEIRDFETAKIAVESALTGHLVLATLHTNDAPGALSRLTDMGVEPFLTASAVDCVIAQRLGRRLCDACKEPVKIEEEILGSMDFPLDLVPEGERNFHRAVGCNRCGGRGYRGRVGFYEMMVLTDEVRETVLRRASTAEISHIAEGQGMVRLRDDGLVKAAQGVTTMEEVLRTVV
jgi:type IV pilus assembly protein PilB